MNLPRLAAGEVSTNPACAADGVSDIGYDSRAQRDRWMRSPGGNYVYRIGGQELPSGKKLGNRTIDMDNLFFILAVTAATVFAGLSKGGFAGVGMIATPLMALVMPPVQAASVMLPILLIQDAYSVVSYRRTVDWRNIAILVPGAVVGIALGYGFAAYLSQGAVALAIGAISLVFGLRSLIGGASAVTGRAGEPAAGLFWGALSGFTSMVAHAGSPPFQIYVMPQRLARDIFVGTSVVFFAVINWVKVPPYLLLGQLTRETLTLSIMLAPLALLSTWLGIQLVRRVDTERFYLIAYALLSLAGLKLCWDGAASLLVA